jgi:hypothetical protein
MALTQEQKAAIDVLVEEYRARCLWYFRRDYFPADDAERWRVLSDIQRHGDRAGFLRAAEAKEWLSPPSSATSASS